MNEIPQPDSSVSPVTATGAEPPDLETDRKKKKKKEKDKIRSAWISFVGRVVAQVVGAVATIALSLYFVQRAQAPRDDVQPRSSGTPPQDTSPRVRPAGGEPALAVLPLRNFSGDPGQDYFADGMTEAIIADLATFKGLRVISRTSSMAYKGHQRPLPEIARELGVDLVVEGSVVKSGDRVRVTAQLIDARSDEHLWAESYDRTIHDVLVLQAQVAEAIAAKVIGVVRASPRLAAKAPVDPEVYDLYLRGRNAWNLRTPEGFVDAIGFFESAIAKAPAFAPAYAGLADVLQLQGLEAAGDGPAKARAAAERALQLDESLGEAHTSLAGVLHRNQTRIADAEREFKRALELNPGHATTHQWYAILLAEEGRDGEALTNAQQAVALDPLSGAIHQALGLVHYYGRRFEDAVSACERALDLAPRLPLARDILGRALLALRRPEDVIKLLEPDASTANPDERATIGLAYLRVGQRPRAEAILEQVSSEQPPAHAALAIWHAGTGDSAAALERLEQLSRQGPGGLQTLRADPRFDSLRSDQRFIILMRR